MQVFYLLHPHYPEKKWGFDFDEIKSANSTWTEDQVKEHVIKNYFNETNFANPKVPVNSTGSKIYMINNYPSVSALGGIGQGTA